MTTFAPAHHPELFAGNVRQVLEASDGTLWLGNLAGGLARVQGTAVTALGEREGVPRGRLEALAETSDGALWIGTMLGLARLEHGGSRAVALDAGLPSTYVHVLRPDADGGLWAGTQEGLARWDAGGQRWRREAGMPAHSVEALWLDADGTLWAGTRQDGLWERRSGVWRIHGVADGLGSNRIAALLRDRRGHLWVATRGGTLAFQDPASGRFQPFPLSSRLCADRINALAEDDEGALWIGTQTCGLHRLHDRAFGLFTEEDGLPSDTVLGLHLIGPTVWLSTVGKGMARWPLDHFAPQAVACAPGLPCEACWDFSASGGRDENLLAVCRNNTVVRWDGQTMRSAAPLPAGLPAASFAIATSDGARWFTLGTTVVRALGDSAEPIRGQEPLAGRRALYEGSAGTVWIIAANGVAAWRKGELQLSRLPAGEVPVEPWNAHEDAEGTLWIGTKGEGIRRVRNGAIATVGVAGGLPSGLIVQVLEDDRGRLWASSGKGIFWVKKRELEAVLDGRQPRVDAHLYDASDGVQMGRITSFGHPAGFKDPRGRLWFATHGGLVVFDPAALRSLPMRPVIEELRVGGQRVDGAGTPALAARGPMALDATFTALTLAPLDTISFRYRLWGRDADWVLAGPGRDAHYAHLEPGSYQLVVEARDREGEWGGQTAQLAFRLRPPFYRSRTFVLLCGLGVGLVLLLVHRLRIAQTRAGLHALMAERTRIARDIHDTLAQAFVATSVQLECLEEGLEGGDPASARRHLNTARKVVEDSLDEARRAVWVLRPQAIEPGLVVALQTLVDRLPGTPAVELQVAGPTRPLPPAIAAELLRIAQEAVANARRHARSRRIEVRLVFLPRAVTLAIADDGKGFDDSAAGGGQGVMGMKERAADIGARLSIESLPDQGTTITVEVEA
jgi:signal transduction histidine kinase/streptogramin lyase